MGPKKAWLLRPGDVVTIQKTVTTVQLCADGSTSVTYDDGGECRYGAEDALPQVTDAETPANQAELSAPSEPGAHSRG